MGDAIGGIVGSIFGGSSGGGGTVAPVTGDLKKYESQYDDPATKAMYADIMRRLGTKATWGQTETPGGWEVVQGASPMRTDRRNMGWGFNRARVGKEYTDPYGTKWKLGDDGKTWSKWNAAGKTTQGTGWTYEDGGTPWEDEVVAQQYNKQFEQGLGSLFGSMANRGILRSGQTAETARKLRETTNDQIAGSSLAARQQAINDLSAFRENERAQQSRAGNLAIGAGNTNAGIANQNLLNRQAQQGEIASLYNMGSNMFSSLFNKKKSSSGNGLDNNMDGRIG